MTPRDLDTQIVVRRLLLLDELLDDLRRIADDPGRLAQDRLARRGVERILTQLVELASDINGHIAVTALGSVPGSYRDSFTLAVRAGVLDEELAAELMPSVGLRNVLVHEYVDIDLDRVAAAVPRAASAYGRYAVAVRDWLLRTRE